jgi:hypothetical protein
MIRRLIILLLIVGCEEPSQHGCLDSQACNYDSSATIDNNSCDYTCACMEGNTCVELEVLYEQAVIDYQNAITDFDTKATLMVNLNDCLQNNCL